MHSLPDRAQGVDRRLAMKSRLSESFDPRPDSLNHLHSKPVSWIGFRLSESSRRRLENYPLEPFV
jgi:hypothetical protein